jgi:hypothetical protein
VAARFGVAALLLAGVPAEPGRAVDEPVPAAGRACPPNAVCTWHDPEFAGAMTKSAAKALDSGRCLPVPEFRSLVNNTGRVVQARPHPNCSGGNVATVPYGGGWDDRTLEAGLSLIQ